MKPRIYTGTLLEAGSHALPTVGKFVKYETAHNLQAQIDYLTEGLRMVVHATGATEAHNIAADVLEGHEKSLAFMGASH